MKLFCYRDLSNKNNFHVFVREISLTKIIFMFFERDLNKCDFQASLSPVPVPFPVPASCPLPPVPVLVPGLLSCSVRPLVASSDNRGPTDTSACTGNLE